MRIEINFNPPPHVTGCYLPGTHLTGQIICHQADVPQRVSSIACEITGTLVTAVEAQKPAKLSRWQHPCDEYRLFQQEQIVSTTPFTVDYRSRLVFPFKFKVPVSTDFKHKDSVTTIDSRKFFSQAEALPPTFSPLHLVPENRSALKCHVRYELHCRAYDGDSAIKEVFASFKVLNVAKDAHPAPRVLETDFPLMLLTDGKRGLRTSFIPTRVAGKPPLFQACVHTPQALAPSQSGDLSISVAGYDPSFGMGDKSPQLFLVSLRVVLYRHVVITASGTSGRGQTVAAQLFCNNKMNLALDTDGEPLCVDHNLRLPPESIHPARLVPDFSLPNVTVKHSITAIARVLHWHTQRTFTMKTNAPFVVLPPLRSSVDDASDSNELQAASRLPELSTNANNHELEAPSNPSELATKANITQLPLRYQMPELPTRFNMPELPARYRLPELPTKANTAELPNGQVNAHELPT